AKPHGGKDARDGTPPVLNKRKADGGQPGAQSQQRQRAGNDAADGQILQPVFETFQPFGCPLPRSQSFISHFDSRHSSANFARTVSPAFTRWFSRTTTIASGGR